MIMLNVVKIDCRKLHENVRQIKSCLPSDCGIAAVVKGNAYGHGIVGIARSLEVIPYIVMFVVSSLEEALVLWQAGIRKNILILDRILAGELKKRLETFLPEVQRDMIRQFIFSAYASSDLEKYSELRKDFDERLTIHLRLDFSAGMRGLTKEDFLLNSREFLTSSSIRVSGIYAHIYSAYRSDSESAHDIQEYAEVFRSIPSSLRRELTLHLLSSVSYFRYPEAAFDMVRIGVSLYGMPVRDPFQQAPVVQPIMSIYAKVVSCVDVKEGGQVDYFGYLPHGVKKVALVSLGSWDIPGFFASRWKHTVQGEDVPVAENYLRIGPHLCRIVGTPCMDTCCLDITGLEDIRIGDEVTVMSDEPGVTLLDWLNRTTFGYEDCQMLFSGMNRLPQEFTPDGTKY